MNGSICPKCKAPVNLQALADWQGLRPKDEARTEEPIFWLCGRNTLCNEDTVPCLLRQLNNITEEYEDLLRIVVMDGYYIKNGWYFLKADFGSFTEAMKKLVERGLWETDIIENTAAYRPLKV